MVSFVWNPLGAGGVVVALVAWALAVGVLNARPDRRQNRRLAAGLFLEGCTFAGGGGLLYLTTDLSTAYGAQVVTYVALAALPATYLLFVATLDSPLVRSLRGVVGSVLLGAIAIGSALFVVIETPRFLLGVAPSPYSAWESVHGPSHDHLTLLFLATSLFGFVVAVSMWRRARPGTIARKAALAFVLAFGARDIGFGGVKLAGLLHAESLGGIGTSVTLVTQWLYTPLALLYYGLLVYGILKTQLFDIDLKIKWTIKKSTIAAAFIAVFFIASETAQEFFGETLGSTYVGIAAAGLLVFALAPLHHVADRLSDRAMPRVEPTPAYVAFRKMEVYKAAVEEIIADGEVNEKDRRVLDRLRAQLGLDGADVEALERDMIAERAIIPQGVVNP